MSSLEDSPELPKLPAPPGSQLIIEQYKAKLSDLGNFGARQTAMTTYYVSIVSALIGIMAFKDRPLSAVDPVVVFFISGVGFFVSLLWLQGLDYFRTVFAIKLQMLAVMEERLHFQTFETEIKQMNAADKARLLSNERLVPYVFMAGFILLALVRAYWMCQS